MWFCSYLRFELEVVLDEHDVALSQHLVHGDIVAEVTLEYLLEKIKASLLNFLTATRCQQVV